MVGQFPHCDQYVLHVTGECVYCDAHPEWQALRAAWGINFTGQHDANKQTCPSEYRRPIEVINAWPGNRAKAAVPAWVKKMAYELWGKRNLIDEDQFESQLAQWIADNAR